MTTPKPTASEVLNFLPSDGKPMPFGKLAEYMGFYSDEAQEQLRERLVEMSKEGTAQIVYGRGWRRLPSPHPDPELDRLLETTDPDQTAGR